MTHRITTFGTLARRRPLCRLATLVVAGVLAVGCASTEESPPPRRDPSVAPARDTKVGGLPEQAHESGHWSIRVGGVPARVRLAATVPTRLAGLSGVTHLDPDEGMLFVYRDRSNRRFWMKGCLMSLDIAFLAEDPGGGDGRLIVRQLATLPAPAPGATDEAMPRAASRRPVRFILEMPGGWFGRNGLGEGTAVELPVSLRRMAVE